MTSGQVTPTPSGPLTSQSTVLVFGGTTFLSWSDLAFHGAMTAPGSAYRALVLSESGSSTTPVIVYFLPKLRTVVTEPTFSPVDFRNGSVAASSSLPCGNSPRTSSILPRASSSDVRNSWMSVSEMPYLVVMLAGTDWMLIAREPLGNVVLMSSSGAFSSTAAFSSTCSYLSPSGSCSIGPIRWSLKSASAEPMSAVSCSAVVGDTLRYVTSRAVTPTTGTAIIATTSALRPLNRIASRRAIRRAARQPVKTLTWRPRR